jgi:hypothetical protein
MKAIVRTCSGAVVGAFFVAIGSLGGCAVSSDGSSAGGEASSTPSSTPTEVASVTAFGAKVTFYSVTMDGKTDIGMGETGSAYASRGLVAPLLSQRLTTLEIYLALATEGATPPPALLAAHADEAVAMGRATEVQHVTIDPSVFVEKNLYTCATAILGTGFTFVSGFDQSMSGGRCLINSFIPYSGLCIPTTKWVVFGGCKESVDLTPMWVNAVENYNNCTNDYQILRGAEIDPGYYHYWYWHNTGGAVYLLTNEGWVCNGNDVVMGIQN